VNQTNFEMLPKASSLAVMMYYDKEEILYSICNAMEKKVRNLEINQHCWKNIVLKGMIPCLFRIKTNKFYGNYSQEFHR
jgi:hypothetical protein